MRLFDMDSKEDYLLDGKYKVATPYAPCVDFVKVVRCTEQRGKRDGGIVSDYAKIDVAIAKAGCWEKCDDFDIELETLYADDFWCNSRIFHRSFSCKNLSKCKKLLESLERSEE